MSPLFLEQTEVKELTGYELPAYQIKWLKNKGWKFEISALGRPVVLRAFAEAKLGLEKPTEPEAWSPNLAAFKKAA